jgi:hypothetical protein
MEAPEQKWPTSGASSRRPALARRRRGARPNRARQPIRQPGTQLARTVALAAGSLSMLSPVLSCPAAMVGFRPGRSAPWRTSAPFGALGNSRRPVKATDGRPQPARPSRSHDIGGGRSSAGSDRSSSGCANVENGRSTRSGSGSSRAPPRAEPPAPPSPSAGTPCRSTAAGRHVPAARPAHRSAHGPDGAVVIRPRRRSAVDRGLPAGIGSSPIDSLPALRVTR